MTIYGVTRSGKSNLLNVLISLLAACPDALIWMIDMAYLCSISGLRPATCTAWVRRRPGTGGLLRASWDPVLVAARGVPDAIDRAAIRNVIETIETDDVVYADYPVPRRHPYGKP